MVTGSRRVTFSDGRSVEFNSCDELIKRTTYVRQQLAQTSVENRKLARYSKGVQA